MEQSQSGKRVREVVVYCASSEYRRVLLRCGPAVGKESGAASDHLYYRRRETGADGGRERQCAGKWWTARGIIPQFMVDSGWCHSRLSELIITESMHERKLLMASQSDAAIALPGGLGTLEELAEILTWKQLGLYKIPSSSSIPTDIMIRCWR